MNEGKTPQVTGVAFVSVFMNDRRWRGIDRFGPAIVHRSILPPSILPTLHLHPTPSTCTRHLNTRIPGEISPSSPIMCKLYYFYPKYISPPCAAPRPLGSTGQIAHVHRKSPPGTVSQCTPPLRPIASPRLPTFYVGLPFFSESHVYSLLV